jgi:hypothetical protein
MLVALVLLVAAATAPANPVRAPKGWKREKLAPQEEIAAAVGDMLGKVKGVDARWWQATPKDEFETEDEAGWLMSIQATVLEPSGTPQQVVDGLADSLAADFEQRGSRVESTPPKASGFVVATRQVETITKVAYIQARAKPGKGGLHVLYVVCTNWIGHDKCPAAMKTIKLTAR